MAEILNSHITDGEGLDVDSENVVTGNGTFDDLMEAVNLHCKAQYDSGRLEGEEYATVYLGALQAAMQNAVMFQLGRQKADKEAENIGANSSILAAKARADIIKNMGFSKATYDVEYNFDFGDLETKDGLIDEQILGEATKTELLDQKITTEKAQTDHEDIHDGTNFNNSILGRQGALYDEQGKSFYWNAVNKWGKLASDSQSVNANIGGTGLDAGDPVDNTSIYSRKGLEDVISDSKPNLDGGSCSGSDTCGG